MVLQHITVHSLLYALVVNGYLFIIMAVFSPRIWGYTDYSQKIKDKVSPQTPHEKRLAWIVALPWMVFSFGFPIYSTLLLKGQLEPGIPVLTAFLNLAVMFLLASLIDLVVLDWLIVSKITPEFVIIPGTSREDYSDFSHHYIAQVRAVFLILPVLLLIAWIISIV